MDGDWNTGDRNTGDWNTGDRNTGDWNTGNRNTGDRNTGDRNTGDWNTGDRNTGDRNTGDWNTGDWNTGDWNTGDWNTGDWNTGDRNTGDRNTGDWNTGDWNTGDWNTGYFCEHDGPVMFFDKPCDLSREEAEQILPDVDLPIGVEWVPQEHMTDADKAAHPNYATVGGYLKKHVKPIREVFPVWWATASAQQRAAFTSLPNFDAEKFERMLGVDVRVTTEHTAEVDAAEPVPDEVVIAGVRYVRAR